MVLKLVSFGLAEVSAVFRYSESQVSVSCCEFIFEATHGPSGLIWSKTLCICAHSRMVLPENMVRMMMRMMKVENFYYTIYNL